MRNKIKTEGRIVDTSMFECIFDWANGRPCCVHAFFSESFVGGTAFFFSPPPHYSFTLVFSWRKMKMKHQ